MANQVTGKNVIVSKLIDGIYYPVFCAKTADFPLEQDEIEVTHVNSGVMREYVPGMGNAMINCAGVTVLDNSENRVSIFYLIQQSIRREIGTYRMRFTDQDGDTQAIVVNAFIRSANVTKDVIAWSQSSVSLRVTGEISLGDVNPPVPPACDVEDPVPMTLAESAVSVSSVLLIPGVGETITILWVDREGLGFSETSGTPGHRQFRYESSTGTIYFDTNAPGAPGGEIVEVGYKVEV